MFTNVQDLCQYKYDDLLTSSVSLLNKYYSARSQLFKRAVQTQVLITEESCHVYNEVHWAIPIVKKLTKQLMLTEEELQKLVEIFDRIARSPRFLAPRLSFCF